MTSKISAVILADSINEHGNRITTFGLTFPRFILVERHASPFEHAAICRGDERYANYQGWESYRHTLGL